MLALGPTISSKPSWYLQNDGAGWAMFLAMMSVFSAVRGVAAR
jgi:hypothetical protein